MKKIITLIFAGLIVISNNALADKIETEYKKSDKVTILLDEDKWGEEKNGFRTQIVPIGEEFVIGKPMNFAVVIQNTSDELKKRTPLPERKHSYLVIKEPNNKEVLNKSETVSIIYPNIIYPIESREHQYLIKKIDITNEYVIINPGKHTIQFSGYKDKGMENPVPDSNVLIFDVKDGNRSPEDIQHDILSRLMSVKSEKRCAPFSWQQEDHISKNGNKLILWTSLCFDENFPFQFRVPPMEQATERDILIQLWQSGNAVDVADLGDKKIFEKREYLGKGLHDQHFYIHIPNKVKKTWLSARKDIIFALHLEK